jgi:hypothetical protein
LGRIAHPKPNPEIIAWLTQLLDANVEVMISEITDYEVRRSLLLADLKKSVARLDQLKHALIYRRSILPTC